jgi:CRP-like cAMP-binding protein
VRAEDRRVGRMERLLHLRTLPILGTLNPEDLGLVAEQARTRVFEKGDRLLRPGEPIGSVLIVIEGRVRLRRGEQVLGHAAPGAAVGGLGYLARDPNGIEAVAETEAVVLELDGDTLDEILEDRFPVLQHLLRETSRRLIDLWHEAPRECRAAQTPMSAPGFKSPLDLVQRMLFLREGLPFIRASASALADLSRGMVELQFDAGTVLWRQGDPGRQVQMVVEGRVTCSSPIEGFALEPQPGYPLGGLEAVAGVPRWYDAVCDSRVVTLSGNAEILFDLFEDNADVALAYLAQIARVHLDVLERIAAAGRESSLLPFFGGNLEA